MDLEVFQSLSASEIAELVRSSGSKVCVFPINGTRRWFMLEHTVPEGADWATVYCDVSAERHIDLYREDNLREAIRSYDDDRARAQPYSKQRFPEIFGVKDPYGWSDDKVRQYSREERAEFGDYIRAQGFRLD